MTWDTILEWVQTNVVESEDLDFKASFWPTKDQKSRSVEIAKDLAAMMNHVGGAVVVGLKDEGDRCAGFSGMPLPRQAESIIRQAAGRHIVPSEAA